MRRLILCLLPLIAYCQLPAPYDSVEVLPFNDHGWYPCARAMEKLIRKNNVKVVVELGAWLGKSTRHIARTLPKDGVVYTVDHWLGDAYISKKITKDNLYQQFLSNVIHSNLTHKIVPLKMTTLEAAEVCTEKGIEPDLIFVDAAHDEESVYADICAWYPFIKDGGIMCGDDWQFRKKEGYPVRRAVERYAKENNLGIRVLSKRIWVFKKKH